MAFFLSKIHFFADFRPFRARRARLWTGIKIEPNWFRSWVSPFWNQYNQYFQLLKGENNLRTFILTPPYPLNDSRSVSGEDLNLYRILEDIKDGQATTSKYDNDNIRFKTPNTLMVFSNKYPDLKKLSKDRWILLHPNKDGLKLLV